MSDDNQQGIKLHYLDKVQAALFEAGRRQHGVAMLYALLSIIVILLTSGAVTINQQFAVAGIVVSASAPVLLLGAACAIAMLEYYDTALTSYQERLRQHLLQSYQSLGFVPDSDPTQVRWSAFLYPDAGTVVGKALEQTIIVPDFLSPVTSSLPQIVKTKKAPRGLLARLYLFLVASVLTLVVLAILPLGAQILAVHQVMLQQGFSWPIGIVIVVLMGLNIATWLTVGYSAPAVFRQAFQAVVDPIPPSLQSLQADKQAADTQDNTNPTVSAAPDDSASTGENVSPTPVQSTEPIEPFADHPS